MRRILRWAALAGLAWVPAVTPAAVSPTTAEAQEAVQHSARSVEELIAPAFDRDDVKDLEVVYEPDRSHLIWKEKRDGAVVALLDGTASQPYDDVAGMTFNPAARVFAFLGKHDGRWLAVVNGKEGLPYDEAGLLTLSNDGRHVAYRAKRRGKWVMVLDGRESDEFDGFNILTGAQSGIPVFSQDSRRFGYHGKQADIWHVWIDGARKPGSQFALPTFSPDSKHVAYPVQAAKKWSVAVDGVAGPDFPHPTRGVVFSPDSQHVAYVGTVSRRGRVSVVVDGKPQVAVELPLGSGFNWRTEVESAIRSHLIFSPDGHRMAYVTKLKGGFAAVVDGKFHHTYKYVSTPAFSADSQHVAYRVSSDDWVDVADPTSPRDGGGVKVPKRWRVVLDGVPTQEYGAVTVPQFTSDNRLQYVAADHTARKIIEVVGERTVRTADSSLDLLVDRSIRGTRWYPSPGGGGGNPLLGLAVLLVDGGMATGYALADALKRDTRIVEFPTLGPNGEVAYSLVDGGARFATRKTDFAHRRIVSEGIEGKAFDAAALDNLQFGPDGALAFELHGVTDLEAARSGRAGDKTWSQVVAHGNEGTRYDEVVHGSLRFASNEIVSYFAVRDAQLFRVTQNVH